MHQGKHSNAAGRSTEDAAGVGGEAVRGFGVGENIFQAIGHPALVLDPQRRVIDANRAAADLFGQPQEHILGLTCHELLHGTGTPPAACPLEAMRASGRFQVQEVGSQTLGRTFLESCTPVLDSDGKLSRIIHISTDVTEHKQTEEELRFTRVALDRMADSAFWMGPDARFVYVNEAACCSLGYSRDELLSMTVHDIDPNFSPPPLALLSS